MVNSYNMFDMYKSVRREEDEMDGGIEYVFPTSMVPIIDEMIMTNNMKLLSKEQEVMLRAYFSEADGGTLSNKNLQLDEFLGTYTGEINE